jgi:hypothetical protein
MTEAYEATSIPMLELTEYFERLIQAHAEEAARMGIEVSGAGELCEDGDVTRIVSKGSEGILATSFDAKTGEIECRWFEADPLDDYDGPWPDFDDIGD